MLWHFIASCLVTMLLHGPNNQSSLLSLSLALSLYHYFLHLLPFKGLLCATMLANITRHHVMWFISPISVLCVWEREIISESMRCLTVLWGVLYYYVVLGRWKIMFTLTLSLFSCCCRFFAKTGFVVQWANPMARCNIASSNRLLCHFYRCSLWQCCQWWWWRWCYLRAPIDWLSVGV